MGKLIDITGNVYGKLTVVSLGNTRKGKRLWNCKCECGNDICITGYELRRGKREACSYCSGTNKDEIGKTFGQLIVVNRLESNEDGASNWNCKCECGNNRNVLGKLLRRGTTYACVKCTKKNQKYIEAEDLTGNVYTFLTVLGRNTTHNIKTKNTLFDCECICGNTTITAGSAMKSGTIKSCGCIQAANFKIKLANMTEEELIAREDRRNLPEYGIWRKDIYKRDNYTCDCCNQKGGQLNAHHLKSYSRFPELRFDLDNGVTLCESCHKEFHSEYGVKRFTSDDYYEFKQNYTKD